MPKTAAKNSPREPRIETPSEFDDVVLEIDRVSRTVKGGRRIRFRALVVVGDRNGRVGMGIGKAAEVAQAVTKANGYAKRHLIRVPITNSTIPHEVITMYGSTTLLLKPASEGTSLIAGSTVRAIAELAGIRNLISKVIGSSNKINNARATFLAFSKLKAEKGKS